MALSRWQWCHLHVQGHGCVGPSDLGSYGRLFALGFSCHPCREPRQQWCITDSRRGQISPDQQQAYQEGTLKEGDTYRLSIVRLLRSEDSCPHRRQDCHRTCQKQYRTRGYMGHRWRKPRRGQTWVGGAEPLLAVVGERGGGHCCG